MTVRAVPFESATVDSRLAWVIAGAALVILSIAYGAPLTTVVALKPIAAEFGATRSAPALAVALHLHRRRLAAASRWAGSPSGSACARW